VGGDSPVLAVVVLLWEVFLVVGEERVQLYTLFEVFNSFHAPDLFEEVEVSVNIDACSDESMPMDTLELDVCVILLELEVDRLVEVYVGTLYRVHVFAGHLELVEVEVLGEHFHYELNSI